ncbi:hypothetical protein FXN63_15530 [Pigmentiphaga aceris]|uniref:Uncharacterized protein n=1 Tax=Pigmentiphaga aceris TaxID=1940612 RepID=A0A5C0B2W2_9BURK|nr:hypothetical protein [Pigmentiphaga aceris]QEI07091.1 hypothetical protein FXN63_15530 [Pigmentiphaga aceris]
MRSISFVAGVAVDKDIYYIASTLDESDGDAGYSVMLFYQAQRQEKWFFHSLPDWRVIDVAFPPVKAGAVREVYGLEENGRIEIYSRNGSTEIQIPGAGLIEDDGQGYVNRIRCIGDATYVCGHSGQIYEKKGDEWADIGLPDSSSGVPAPSEADAGQIANTNVLDIGLDAGGLIAIGTEGMIARRVGVTWQQVPRLTAADLHGICADENGRIWIVGQRGTVVCEADDTFKVLTTQSLDTDFYSVASFGQELYIGAEDGLYSLVDGSLERLAVSDTFTLSGVSRVESKDGVLWVLSAKKLLRYNGADWECFEHPNNAD